MKYRFLPCAGWTICSFLFMFIGWIAGAGIRYFSTAVGWVKYSDEMFSGLNFLKFPFVGGIVGLIAMHIIRILCWTKLRRRYMEKYEGWTWKYTMGFILFDEALWLMAFVMIWKVLLLVL